MLELVSLVREQGRSFKLGTCHVMAWFKVRGGYGFLYWLLNGYAYLEALIFVVRAWWQLVG